MTRTFKGRPVIAGAATARALVSHAGVNILASLQKDMLARKTIISANDQNNPDTFGRVFTGSALCLPQTIGSTTGGMVLQKAAAAGAGPRMMLFAEKIDSLAAAGVILAKVWNGVDIITVDGLGDEFLAAVHTGDTVEVQEDGTVTIGVKEA